MRRMGRPSPRPSLLQPGGGGTTTSDADSQAQAVTDDAAERVRRLLPPRLWHAITAAASDVERSRAPDQRRVQAGARSMTSLARGSGLGWKAWLADLQSGSPCIEASTRVARVNPAENC